METEKRNETTLTRTQNLLLAMLRITIGWHFLYEGISKMLIPDWTSAGYLENSRWLLSRFFHWIASNGTVLTIVDWMNIVGLTLVGLALVIGLFTRFASICGILLLALYYIANPPFVGTDFGIPLEGHYLAVNKNLVEMVALLLIAVFPGRLLPGLDRLFGMLRPEKRPAAGKALEAEQSVKAQASTARDLKRREILKSLASVPILGVFAYGTVRKYRWESVNAVTGATIKVSDTQLKDLKGNLPFGRIKDFKISRLFIGGNLIGGWAHSRDLIYVSSLFKEYNTDVKVFETLSIAEKAGVNTINISWSQLPIINKYKRIFKSGLQTICQVHPTREDVTGDIDKAIGEGADLIQIQGNCCDFRVRDGQVDVLVKAMDTIRKRGYTAGMGAHSIQALMATDKAGIRPDFYMKTLHHDQYWSAHPKENRIPFSVDGDLSPDHDKFHDNMFCLFPDATIEFMKDKKIPWIAFKVLAGGAIHPSDGFKFAFENGADFVCAGMFDWQIVDDVNIALDVLGKVKQRKRPWMG
jgi:uncharacterized membrane protein YphA (DoxX/SURF4 family)